MNPTMRPELEELPERMRKLPLDKRGYPVPWFVGYINGEPEFRAMDGDKFIHAIKLKLCWVCGQPLGRHKTFVIGPMCGINRTTSEPPAHLECARWSARNCPFLTLRQIKRREDEFTEKCPMAGFAIKRNPGVALLWTTLGYELFSDHRGGALIRIGDPLNVEWFSHGRTATRAEAIESVESGFPILAEQAEKEPGAMEELLEAKRVFEQLYPPDL